MTIHRWRGYPSTYGTPDTAIDPAVRVRDAAGALIPRARRAFQLSGVRDDALTSALSRVAYAKGYESTARNTFEALERLRTLLLKTETAQRPKWTPFERNKLVGSATDFIEKAEKYLKKDTLRRLQSPVTSVTGSYTKFAQPLMRPVRQGFNVPPVKPIDSDLFSPSTQEEAASHDDRS